MSYQLSAVMNDIAYN